MLSTKYPKKKTIDGFDWLDLAKSSEQYGYRPLTHIYRDKTEFVATDGHRMHIWSGHGRVDTPQYFRVADQKDIEGCVFPEWGMFKSGEPTEYPLLDYVAGKEKVRLDVALGAAIKYNATVTKYTYNRLYARINLITQKANPIKNEPEKTVAEVEIDFYDNFLERVRGVPVENRQGVFDPKYLLDAISVMPFEWVVKLRKNLPDQIELECGNFSAVIMCVKLEGAEKRDGFV